MKRVTITLPDELLAEIDAREPNRSRFLAEAAREALHRRRREELERALEAGHPEAARVADAGFGEWLAGGSRDADELLDPAEGVPVRWRSGSGWEEPTG